MKRKRITQSAFFRLCIPLGLIFFFAGTLLVLFAAANPTLPVSQRKRHVNPQVARQSRALTGDVHEAWVATYNGPGNLFDGAQAIRVDSLGNVYVAGSSLGDGTSSDYATIKYNSAGQEQWVARYNDPDNFDDYLAAMAVDGSGNVYVTGQSATNGGIFVTDCATIKYNSAGEQQWVARYNVQPRNYTSGKAIAVDDSGNVYVLAFVDTTGVNARFFTTIKYNSAGEQQWAAEYQSGTSDDEPAAITVDGSGNVYVTGMTQTCEHGYDYVTLKYNSSGEEQWMARYDGPGHGDDSGAAIAVDGTGNVYVTGYSYGATNPDYATIKYDSTGQQLWVARYDQGGFDYAHSLTIDGSGDVYVTGEIADPNDYPDYGTNK
jgi:hypothetical protein